MTIRAGSGTVAAVCDASGPFALQVQHSSDPAAALSAARLARVDIVGLGATVEPVVNAPAGPLLLVTLPGASYDTLRQIPDLILGRLEELGLASATLAAVPTGGRLDGLDAERNAVLLRVFGRPAGPAGTMPASWLDLAGEWVAAGSSTAEPVRARILTVEHDLAPEAVHDVLHECLLARSWCDVVAGTLGDRIRTTSLMFGRVPHLVLAAGGGSADRDALLAWFDLLRDVARELAPSVAYACLDFEPSFEGLAFGLASDGWHRLGGAPPNDVAARLVDELVPDAFGFQVLGPAHRERLGIAGARVPGERLKNGRTGVTIGLTEDWLRTAVNRDDVHAAGAELLAPLLATTADADALAEGRAHRPLRPGPDDSAPDLDAVVIEPSPHAYRGTRLTLLELAAFMHHEPHSDHPASVSPVIAAFVRWWAAGVDDAYRQRLRELAPRLAGTAGDADADGRRRWMVARWLACEHAQRWLTLAGLFEPADELADAGALTEHEELMTVIGVLGRAAAVANRRADITASLSVDRDEEETDRQAAWQAWERVADAAGWSAACEAATEGIAPEVADAANLAALETARAHPPGDVTAATWSAALHAVAREAWDQGWQAADRLARDLTGATIRVEMGRVAKRSLRELADDEQLEAAEQAANESLVRSVLDPSADADRHPWDTARDAARRDGGGAAWATVVDEVERLLGEQTWAQAMADARAAVDACLRDAADRCARAVLVAVAREASGAAARAAALRAAAVARAGGADDHGASKAATETLTPAGDRLRDDAAALVDALLSPARGRGPRR